MSKLQEQNDAMRALIIKMARAISKLDVAGEYSEYWYLFDIYNGNELDGRVIALEQLGIL